MNTAESMQSFVREFSPNAVELVLAGTGLNGAAQVSQLYDFGCQELNSLKRVHVVSGSAFSYFVIQASVEQHLQLEHFVDFDSSNRGIHKAKFWRNAILAPKVLRGSHSFFENDLLEKTVRHIFSTAFCNQTLSHFSDNLSVWSYCENHKQLIEISNANGFGEMNVCDMIRATASTSFLHGAFHYKGYAFTDPNFSPQAKLLRKRLIRGTTPTIVLNYKKSEKRAHSLFIKHGAERFPDFAVLRDFLLFVFNIPNWKVSRTNRHILLRLR